MMTLLPALENVAHSKRAAIIASVVMGIVLAALPFMIGSGLGNSWLRIIDFAMLYIMLALGLNIVVGFAGLLDLGYIAFYAVGAYLYALLASPHFGLHLPVWLIIPAGAALAGFSAPCWVRQPCACAATIWLSLHSALARSCGFS